MYKCSLESIERCVNAIGKKREEKGLIVGNETLMYNPISKQCKYGEWEGKANNAYSSILGYIEIDITGFRKYIRPQTDRHIILEIYELANKIIEKEFHKIPNQ